MNLKDAIPELEILKQRIIKDYKDQKDFDEIHVFGDTPRYYKLACISEVIKILKRYKEFL